MNAHTPFDAKKDWSNPYCQNSSNDQIVDALLGNAYHVVRTVYCNLGNLKLMYDFLNQYGMVIGVQSEAELKALTADAKYARIYGFSRAGDRQVTDYLYVEGDRTGIIPDNPEATGSWITVATSGSNGGDTSSGGGAYIPWVYANGSATGGETTINVPDDTVGVPFIIVNGDMQYVGRGFEFNADNLSVTLAQPLEEGDEVVFLLTGTPAVPDNPNVSDWIQINWLYNQGAAVGGEQIIAVPYTFQSVPAVYKNGLRLYKGLSTESYTADPDNQRIFLTEPLATNDRLIVQIGGEIQALETTDRTFQEVARAANVKDSELILSTDTTQCLNGKKIVYSVSEQKAYGLPSLPSNVYISSVSNGQLTYNPGNVTVALLPTQQEMNTRELWRHLLAEAGLSLVEGSFEKGATVNSKSDAVWYIAGGQCYTWGGALPKVVASGSTPSTAGGLGSGKWVSVDDAALRTGLASESGAALVGTKKSETLDVVLQDINSGFFAEFGPQLRKLNSALLDPLVQELQITFIGDSITWGTGSSGAAASGTRDGTLSDPRNNSTSPSYVNQLGRLIAAILGTNTVTTFSNHSYSPSGESIREMVTDKYEFPYGSAYSVVGSGSFMDVIDTNVTGPYLGARRTITVTTGASASLSFNFTGSKFSLVYSQLPNSADYELLVNGVSQGVFTTRGDTVAFNTRRAHSFGFVINGTVTIRALQHSGDTGNQQLRIEALMFPKTVRIKNQGIIGTTTERYAMYNFPTALSRPKPYPPQNMPGFSQTFVGTGGHEYVESAEPNAILGVRYKYSFTNSGSWEITLNPAATDDRVAIYFSSTDKTCDVQVLADGVAIETFHTSSNEQGVPFGYQNSRVVSIPVGTTTVKIKTVFVQYQSSVSYLYLEGLRTFSSNSLTYPTNNNFKDGVALDDKDMFAFFQVGVNDRESKQVKSPTQIRVQLEKMLSLIPPGCSPILMASNPAKEAGNYSMQDMVQAIRQTAEKNNVAFIDNFNLFDKYSMTYFTTDNLHPNDIGHNMIARNIIKSIRSS